MKINLKNTKAYEEKTKKRKLDLKKEMRDMVTTSKSLRYYFYSLELKKIKDTFDQLSDAEFIDFLEHEAITYMFETSGISKAKKKIDRDKETAKGEMVKAVIQELELALYLRKNNLEGSEADIDAFFKDDGLGVENVMDKVRDEHQVDYEFQDLYIYVKERYVRHQWQLRKLMRGGE